MAYTSYWHAELPDSPNEQGSNETGGSFSADVKLMVRWEDRLDVLAEIIGGFQLYPRAPSSGARAVSGSSKPYPARTGNEVLDYGFARYDRAEVSIKYQLKAETSDLISESLEPTAEFLTLKHQKCRWKEATRRKGMNVKLEENEAPGRLQRAMDYKITFYRVMALPNWFDSLIDCVNKTQVQSRLLGMTFEKGTLLFNPPNTNRKWNFTKFPYWQVDLKLTHRPSGWNRFWCGSIQDYDTIQINDGTDETPHWSDMVPYQEADFSPIWTLGAKMADKEPPKVNAPGVVGIGF